MKRIVTFILALSALFSCKIEEDSVYLFSYFTDNGQDGLHLAYSHDGLTWEALNDGESFLTPTVGKDRLMRDPSIVQDEDGVFHMVWTTGWWDQGIGYASSIDLVNWSEQKNIPVMEGIPVTVNTWSPELFYDSCSKTFYIFWSSTVTETHHEPGNEVPEEELYHRQYYVTTKDFKNFSDTKLYFEPGFSVIDGAMIRIDDQYHLFIKDETKTPAEKNIRLTSNDKPHDFPTDVSDPITGDYWAEGPSPLQIGEYVYVFFDKYTQGRYGAVRSKDMKTWEDVSDLISFPKGTRHGTAFKVTAKMFDKITDALTD